MVKFQKHSVTNGQAKARVSYGVDGLLGNGRKCVTVYAKDYDESLYSVLSGAGVQKQDINPMDDCPGDRAIAVFYEDHPMYAAARQCAERRA